MSEISKLHKIYLSEATQRDTNTHTRRWCRWWWRRRLRLRQQHYLVKKAKNENRYARGTTGDDGNDEKRTQEEKEKKNIQQPTESLISLQENNVVGFRICITEFVSSLVLIVRFFRMSLLSLAAAACLPAGSALIWHCLNIRLWCMVSFDSFPIYGILHFAKWLFGCVVVATVHVKTRARVRDIRAAYFLCQPEHPTNHTQLRALIKNNLIFHLNSNKTR